MTEDDITGGNGENTLSDPNCPLNSSGLGSCSCSSKKFASLTSVYLAEDSVSMTLDDMRVVVDFLDLDLLNVFLTGSFLKIELSINDREPQPCHK